MPKRRAKSRRRKRVSFKKTLKRTRSKSRARARPRRAKSSGRRVGARRVYKAKRNVSLSTIRREIQNIALWHGQDTKNYQGRFTVAANAQGWVHIASVACRQELEPLWLMPQALQANTNMYGTAPSYRQGQVYLYNHKMNLNISSATSPAGTRVWVYMLTPRRAITAYEGDIVKSIEGSYDSSGALAYVYKTDATLIATRIDQSPYKMSQITNKYKVKQLWSGILATGRRKDITVRKFFGSGRLIRQDHYTTPDGTGLSLNNLWSIPSAKPYEILVRFQGLTGGDAATNPTTVGISAASITCQGTSSYTYGFGLHAPVLNSTFITPLGLAGFTTGAVVSAAGAVAYVA